MSPFTRMLQDCAQLANTDADAAFGRLDDLYGKSCTPEEVQQLATFVAHLGSSLSDRPDESLGFLDRMLEHPAIQEEQEDIKRSIYRAQAVLHSLMGNEDDATAAREKGVTNASEQCRIAVMTAQTMVARQNILAAIPHLKMAGGVVQELAADDMIVQQCAQISLNIVRAADQQAKRFHELLITSAQAAQNALAQNENWRVQHMGLYHLGGAYVTAGKPTEALDAVKKMMKLEKGQENNSFEQLFTASLACRAQILRGQKKVAAGALNACKKLINDIPEEDERRQQAVSTIEELSELVTG